MKLARVACPACGSAVGPWRGAKFPCPNCGQRLRVKPGYLRAVNLVSLCVYVVTLLAAGVRGPLLFYAILAGPMVALYVGIPVAATFFPPRVELDQPTSRSLFGR